MQNVFIVMQLPNDVVTGNAKAVFWADQLADAIADRASSENRIATCKSAASPSGAKHMGNLFDVMKAYFPFKALVKNGINARFVLTHDDRDPLRTIPSQLPDKEGIMQSTKDFCDSFMKYMGIPYSRVPDPFDCCHSWAEHFAAVWENGIYAMDIRENEIKTFSADVLYSEGEFDRFIALALADLKKTVGVFAPFQQTVKPDYIPFHAICENCGKITTKTVAVDLASRTARYECLGKSLAGKYKIEGCGHRGEASWHDGKLPWRFEWPATWGIFGVMYEPFGKEHAEGSWPSGQVICRDIYGFEPPISHIYEFVLVNGQKMSARFGNVYIVQQILEILEPEVFSFFYTKRSGKQRNFDINHIYQLVADFEKAEKIYFGVQEERNEEDRMTLARQYESVMQKIPEHMPKRIEYQFAAVVGQLAPNVETAIRMLRHSGHIEKSERITSEDEFYIARRLNLARNWARTYATENLIEVKNGVSEDVMSKLSSKEKESLRSLASSLTSDISQDVLYNTLFEIASGHELDPKVFFRAAYMAILGRESGPRLAPFILALGRDRVRGILESV